MRLDTDYNYMTNTQGVAKFKAEYAADVSSALGISIERVQILSVVPGSIIVETMLTEGPANSTTLADVKKKLTGLSPAQVADTFKGGIWSKYVDASTFEPPGDGVSCCGTFKTGASACACISTPLPPSQGGKNIALILGLVAGLVTFVLLLVFIVFICSKKTASEEPEADPAGVEMAPLDSDAKAVIVHIEDDVPEERDATAAGVQNALETRQDPDVVMHLVISNRSAPQ
jgi:hypothetical protein